MGASTDIFIVGATNRPDLVDPTLRTRALRQLAYVSIASDVPAH